MGNEGGMRHGGQLSAVGNECGMRHGGQLSAVGNEGGMRHGGQLSAVTAIHEEDARAIRPRLSAVTAAGAKY